jgi:hypothetical protein
VGTGSGVDFLFIAVTPFRTQERGLTGAAVLVVANLEQAALHERCGTAVTLLGIALEVDPVTPVVRADPRDVPG